MIIKTWTPAFAGVTAFLMSVIPAKAGIQVLKIIPAQRGFRL